MKKFITSLILRLLFVVVAVVLFPIWLVLIPIYWVWFCVMYIVGMSIGWILNGKDGMDFVRRYILFMEKTEVHKYSSLGNHHYVYFEYGCNLVVYRWYWDIMEDFFGVVS